MFDALIFFAAQHIVIATLALAIFNFAHLLFYKGLNFPFVFFNFFAVFPEVNLSSNRPEKVRRYKFMRTHNILTITFYSFSFLGILLHFTLPH
jgi:hypothetical protein